MLLSRSKDCVPTASQAAALEPLEALSLCAEIAIAITGFSGVVLVLGDRTAGAPVGIEQIMFRTLFTATLIPLGIIAVAFILDASTFEPTAIWRILSTIHVLAVSAISFFNIRAVAQARSTEDRLPGPDSAAMSRVGAAVFFGAFLVMALQLANAITLHSFWPVLVAVWWAIAVSLFAFVGLLGFSRAT
jgi:hypothetical protein